MNIFSTVLKRRHDFHRKKFKGHNSIKNVDGVKVLFLCTSPDGGLYCTKFYENNLNSIKVIEGTRFS